MFPSPNHLESELAALFGQHAPDTMVAAYLFGGHAEGRAHRESDVDVAVLLRRERLPTARERFEERARLTAWLGAELRAPLVDLVVLDDAPATLAAHIVTRGVRVYCADAEAEHAFRRDAQLLAADLAPFLRRTRRLTLEALRR